MGMIHPWHSAWNERQVFSIILAPEYPLLSLLVPMQIAVLSSLLFPLPLTQGRGFKKNGIKNMAHKNDKINLFFFS